jgi:hypothetical protein
MGAIQIKKRTEDYLAKLLEKADSWYLYEKFRIGYEVNFKQDFLMLQVSCKS